LTRDPLTAPTAPATPKFVFEARDKRLALGERTAVMGVINVTPDSFFEESRKTAPAEAIAAALEMIEAGASIIDLGGESTRPGAQPVPVDEEIHRLSPVLTGLRRLTKVPISIDTRKSKVAEVALDLGADIVNDVTSLRGDTQMAEIVARSRSGLVLMHMKGGPETMQMDPVYGDAVEEIRDFLSDAVERAEQAGISPDSILIDPGIGFGKTTAHNLQILNRLDRFASLGKPVLVGTSRKTFIGKVLDFPPEDRLHGTAATVAAAVLRGAHVVRVHDVAEMLQVVRVVDAIKNETLVATEQTAVGPPTPKIRRLVRYKHCHAESEGGQTETGGKGGVA
jgi:dihydropteroate synthase